MTSKSTHKILTFCIALIWIANGLFCKILNFVPRHEQIVARILGDGNSRLFTIIIGSSEVAMAIWILSGFHSRCNATVQIAVVTAMNILEFFLAPDLLLWGRFNALFAILYIMMVYYNEFYLKKY